MLRTCEWGEGLTTHTNTNNAPQLFLQPQPTPSPSLMKTTSTTCLIGDLGQEVGVGEARGDVEAEILVVLDGVVAEDDVVDPVLLEGPFQQHVVCFRNV